MDYLIRERVFALGNKFDIEDSMGQSIYRVESQIFALGRKLRIYNRNGEEVAYIEQRIPRLLPEYDIYIDGRQLGSLKKELSFFRPSFAINSDYGDFEIEGDVLRYNFSILKNGRPVASISKKFLALYDSYMVSVDDDLNQAFILALVIILDQVHHDQSSSSQ